MRAAIFEQHGEPEVIEVSEVDDPTPGPGEVRLRVRAASLNHLDVWVRRGLPIPIPMPHIGGADMAGDVDAVGAGVEHVSIGTRVVVDPSLDWDWYERPSAGKTGFRILGEHTQGGFAEFAVVPALNLLPLPDHVSFETAAASGLTFVTAWRALVTRGNVQPGDRVLITGGSGGVSTAAIQIARRAGARVHAITSGARNVERVEALGAEVVLDRTQGDLDDLLKSLPGGGRMDLALDSVGEPVWEALIGCLDPGGRLVTYGTTGGGGAMTDLRRVFWRQISILGTTMGSPAEFRTVMGLVFEGHLAPVIDRILDLNGVAKAHRALETGEVFGKVVVRV